jgi:hypothetical protein
MVVWVYFFYAYTGQVGLLFVVWKEKKRNLGRI